MSPEEFQQLFRHIESADVKGFFEASAAESQTEERRIYLSTTSGSLYFCFTQHELEQLRRMLDEAMNRLTTLEKAWTELN